MQPLPMAPEARRAVRGGAGPLALALCLAVLVPAVSLGKGIHSFAGPYIAYGDRFYSCQTSNGSEYPSRLFIKATHFNPSAPTQRQLITGTSNLTHQLDDGWWATADMALRSNNQWKRNAFVFRFPAAACSALRANIPHFFKIIFQRLGDAGRAKGPCFVPAGTYSFDREPVDWVFPNFPVMPYGFYRLQILAGPRDDQTGNFCMAAECHIIPKL